MGLIGHMGRFCYIGTPVCRFDVGTWKRFHSGYNVASKEEKEKYDERKVCRTTEVGMAVIAGLILVMGLFENVLPAEFAYVAFGIVIIDCLIIIIVCNTFCRK